MLYQAVIVTELRGVAALLTVIIDNTYHSPHPGCGYG